MVILVQMLADVQMFVQMLVVIPGIPPKLMMVAIPNSTQMTVWTLMNTLLMIQMENLVV